MNNQATSIVNNLGWEEIELSSESLKYQNDLINYSDNIIENKKNNFFTKDSFQNELTICALRSILRYSNQSKIFLKYLVKDLVKLYPGIKDFYITPPYIIFHESNELKKEEGYHSDAIKYCGKLYTSWTPINNYKMDYPALSVLNKSHSYYAKIIFKILNKFKFSHNNVEKILKILFVNSLDLIVKKNCTYLWDSDLLHKGNHNKTRKPHVALVVRISEEPLYYEPTAKISELISSNNLTNNENQVDLHYLSSMIFKICEIAKKKNDLIEYSCNLRDISDKHFLKHISFSLSLLAQRYQNNFSSNLDLISFILGKENLVSLERFLIKFKDNDISKKIIKKFFINKNLSYQESIIVKKFKNQNLDDVSYQKKLSWLV
jgi:hypothetical protein